MGNQGGGVKDRHPSDGGGGRGGEGGGQESKRIEEMVAPLCTARLRPTRQKTKNAVANITGASSYILDETDFFVCFIMGQCLTPNFSGSGEVCMEFLKMRRGEERVVEVIFKILLSLQK